MRNRWVKAVTFTLGGIVALCIALGADALDTMVATQGCVSAAASNAIAAPPPAGCTARPF